GTVRAGWEATGADWDKVWASVPAQGCGSPRVSLVRVNVPVLPEQRTSTPANSSIASSRETIALLLASLRAPRAIVTERTAGIATGTDATRRIRTISASLNRTARS